jgi:Tfp pilus assembly protein PilX
MHSHLKHHPSRGFALVVTLSLMILLTVIAVGLLTLSSTSLRSSSQSDAMATARSNARMALLLAIGELQKSTGPDQRVTSPANVAGDSAGLALAAGAPPVNDTSINGESKGLTSIQPGTRYWTGVWKNSNTTTPGLEIYTKTPSPEFIQWLVSGNERGAPSVKPSDGDYAVNSSGAVSDIKKAVVLAGKNSVGSNAEGLDRHVVVPLVQVTGKDPSKPIGRYGWWVGDEGVKAKINISKTLEDKSNYAALVAQRRGWETVPGFSDPGSPYPDPSSAQQASLPKIITLPQAELLLTTISDPIGGSSPLQSVFHSASTDSKALLTDSLNGGMKLDLTAILASDLPTNSPVPAVANYPVKDGNVIPAKINLQDTVAAKMKAPRWNAIKDFADRATQLDGGALVVKPATSDFATSIAPIVTDFRMLLGARIKVKNAAGRTYGINPCAKIAVAIANPYSYPLKWTSDLEIEIRNQTPTGNDPSRIWGNLSPRPAYLPKGSYPSTEAAVFNNAIFKIPAGTLSPGEAVAYTMGSPILRAAASTSKVTIGLSKFASSAPFNFNNCLELTNNATYSLVPDPAKPNEPKRFELDIRESFQTSLANIEISLAGAPASGRLLRRIERLELDNGYYSPNQRRFYHTRAEGTARNEAEPIAASEMTQPFPLMLFSFQISQPGGPYKDYMPSTYDMGQRGSTLRTFADFNLQATRIRKPIASYNPPPYFAESNDNQAQLAVKPPGGETGSAFTRDFALVARWGRSSKSGSEKTILFSVPAQLSTLGQLQHADLTGDDISSSIGHQPGNAAGNSYATPFVKRGLTAQNRASYELKGAPDKSGTNSIYPTSYYDLSYLLNTALWDSYFFSTVPRSGTSVPENPTLVKFNSSDTSGAIKDPTGLEVAPQLFIDGGFNVNSTDKNAWKVFLASAKHLKHVADSTANTDAAFPRGLEQISSSASPPTGKEADSFSGFRRLTDPQLDALATEIVKQVRLRGPFVSISHFLNRALAPIDNQPALSRSGALQAAIDESGANIAFQGKKSGFTEIDPTEDAVTLGWKNGAPRADYDGGHTGSERPSNDDYAKSSADKNYGTVASIFADRELLSDSTLKPEQGFRSTGIPGWLTQADVLQVIGASITARSDTFRIRAFGEALDATGKSTAKAYCEAVIQRNPNYVDPSNPPTARDSVATPLSNINKIHGRQYQIVSFRWLSAQEI